MFDQQIELHVLPKKKIKEFTRNLFTSKWKAYLELFPKSEAYGISLKHYENIKSWGISSKNTKPGNKDCV